LHRERGGLELNNEGAKINKYKMGVWNWMRKVIDDLQKKKKKFGVEWWRWLSKREGLEVNNEGEQHVKWKKKGFELSNESDLHKTRKKGFRVEQWRQERRR
jgi:hypothetical protein